MISPGSSKGTSWLIKMSTTLPAITINMHLRGLLIDFTNSSILWQPTIFFSFPRPPTKSSTYNKGRNQNQHICCLSLQSTLETVRLNTATVNPLLSMLRMRFSPITASPITPMSAMLNKLPLVRKEKKTGENRKQIYSWRKSTWRDGNTWKETTTEHILGTLRGWGRIFLKEKVHSVLWTPKYFIQKWEEVEMALHQAGVHLLQAWQQQISASGECRRPAGVERNICRRRWISCRQQLSLVGIVLGSGREKKLVFTPLLGQQTTCRALVFLL